MTHATTRIIREEHAALSAVLRSISLLLGQHRRKGTLPDFAVLRAMLFYVDEFPEKRHHRKESDVLFPKLRARAPLSRELLDHLDADHALGAQNIRDLEHELLGFEMMGEPRREAFGANRDPLTGHEPEADFRALFTRLVNIVPAPIGLGAAN